MRWRFGGNLQSVRTICRFDWRECPFAVVNYVWSEIVTDVVDTFNDGSMMWRVLAMLFVCTLLIHTIYSKTRWIDETTVNRNNLNVVGCKVQDLELKVNILTYKMQYGTWPLPRQIQGTRIDGGLRNVRLTLTNSNDRNAWLKHMLLSPTENGAYLPYAKIGPRSVRCLTKLINLETKYMSSRFGRDASPSSNRAKSSRSASEKSIKYEKTSEKSLDVVKAYERPGPATQNLENKSKASPESSRKGGNNSRSESQVPKYREHLKLFSRQQRACANDLKAHKNILPSSNKSDDLIKHSEKPSTCNEAHSRREHQKSRQQSSPEFDFTKFQAALGKSESIDRTPVERVNSTQETLQQVTQKLENLHNVLRTVYGSENRPTKSEGSSSKELAESILRDLKNIGSLPIESGSDGKTSGVDLQLPDSNTEESQATKEEEESGSEFEQRQSDRDSSSARSNENFLQIDSTAFSKQPDTKILSKDSEVTVKSAEESREVRTTIDRGQNNSQNISRHTSPAKTSPLTKISTVKYSDKSAHSQPQEESPKPSINLNGAESSRKSNSDEISKSTATDEALKLKKALLSQIGRESEREQHRERRSEESEGESDEPWPKANNYFQSKQLLDIISEEQSASSSTDKTGKPQTFVKAAARLEHPEDQSQNQKNSIEAASGNSDDHGLALVSKSSEYFSLSNLEEKMLSQSPLSSSTKDILQSSSDFSEDELNKTNKPAEKVSNEVLHKDIDDLVNRSVQNIREYIKVFSKMQSDAILDAKAAIFDENFKDSSDIVKKSSSADSIMHFVNTVALVDSMSEELPRELPEPTIDSLVDIETEVSREQSLENVDYQPDFALKRRPGFTSLAGQNFTVEKEEPWSREASQSRANFEFALSGPEDDCPVIKEPEIGCAEPSCKELVMDYLLESDSDFTDEKQPETLNLIEFEEETLPGETEDDRRAVESPLTGRTVIRASSSLTTNLETDSISGDRSESAEFVETGNSSDPDGGKKMFLQAIEREEETIDDEISRTKVAESDRVNDVNEVSDSRTNCGESSSRAALNQPESYAWVIEKLETDENSMKIQENFAADSRDSAISESLAESFEFGDQSENCDKRPNSAATVIIKNVVQSRIESAEISSKINSSSDTSGTYIDASSRDLTNPSLSSLAFDRSILNNRAATGNFSRSARDSSSSLLQQRISGNPPRRASSLNSATSKKPEKGNSRSESLEIARSKSLQSKPSRLQSSAGSQLKVRSNFSLNSSKDLESSSISISGRRAEKISSEMNKRRSRSYVTPRKNESSPGNSQLVESQRVSRIPRESARSKSNPENSKPSEHFDKYKSTTYEMRETVKKYKKFEISEKSPTGLSATEGSSLSNACVMKKSLKSCIPVPRRCRVRAKSPMRGPLTMSTSSWREETLKASNSPLEDPQAEGSIARSEENSQITKSPEAFESFEKDDGKSHGKLPESRTVIYVNVATEQEHTVTRVVDPKKFLEYLKERQLKIQKVFDPEFANEDSDLNTAAQETRNSPRVLTIVSSAVGKEFSNECELQGSNNSSPSGSWSLRVGQREIEVSAKPSVIDTSTSISDLPENSTVNHGKFEIFQVPKELTKDEYIVLLEALNQDPNLNQLREMRRLCSKLGLGFHE